MSNEFNHLESFNDEASHVQIELLEALLEPDDAVYPWDTTEPESEAYFNEREELVRFEWQEEEIGARSLAFFSKLEQIWLATEAAPATPTAVRTLQETLRSKLTIHVPQDWLDTIARRAYQVVATQQSIADKLVQCVQELLPDLAQDNLEILARPLAYAMRTINTETIESALGNVSQDWTSLSEFQKARLSLAIARYALVQLNSEQPKSN